MSTKNKINKFVLDGKVKEDRLGFANTNLMKNHFANIGFTVDAKISISNSTYQSYMDGRNVTNFHISEVSQTDILEIIKKNEQGKSIWPI